MKKNRKRVMSIAMVLMLMLLCLAALAPSVSAGIIGDVPVKPFKVDAVSYDRDAAEFVVKLSCKFGTATAGEHADFTIRTSLKIDTGESVFLVDPRDDGIQKETGAKKDADNFIELEAQRIPWDRNGGTYEGTALVSVSIELLNPGGRSVSEVDSEEHPVKIKAEGEDPPEPEPDEGGK